MKRSLPRNRRVALVSSLAAIFAGLIPIFTKAVPHHEAHLNTAVFLAGLGVGLSFALAVGVLVRWRLASRCGG